jgi:hypothetical protein
MAAQSSQNRHDRREFRHRQGAQTDVNPAGADIF